MRNKSKKIIIKTLLTALMAAMSIIMVLPFLWMISSSFKPDNKIFCFPIQWIPDHATLANYDRV